MAEQPPAGAGGGDVFVPSERALLDILAEQGVPENQIVNIYLFGSHTFGCATATSDYDFLIVLKKQISGEDHLFHDTPKMDLVLMSEEGFETALREHVLWVVQCVLLPPAFVIRSKRTFVFRLDKSTLRQFLMQECNRTWVKAKKKLTVENSPILSRKNICHSLRALMFGCQLAEHGSIVDWTCANDLHGELTHETSTDWGYFDGKYGLIWNRWASRLRQLCPKGPPPQASAPSGSKP
jgi:predicted nucleotidyltransferase